MREIDIINALKDLGFTTVSKSFYEHISNWRDWYKGKADFHFYNMYNGKKMIKVERQSLGMAKKVSEDKADLLLNEKVGINIEDEKSQETLDKTLDDNSFWVEGNQLIEKSQALGTGAIVEYMEGEEIKLNFIEADNIYPLSWDNGKIIDCAFASIEGENLQISIHLKQPNGTYNIENRLFDSDGEELGLPQDMVPEWNTGSTMPLFQIIKPNIVNNIDTTSPMGISIFANAIDVLKGIDLVYDSYDNEFKLGKKRIFVDSTVTKIDFDSGESQPLFDSNDTVFYSFPFNSSEKEGNKPIEESDMTLRAQEHETALQSRLNILSAKCGFGQNYYQFDKTGVKTATEVVSENSQLFRTIKKDEIILNKALTDMVRVILFLSKLDSNQEVSIHFDDSIIEDTEALSKRAMLEYNSGLIDAVEYYQRVYGYTEEQAKKLAEEIEERKPKEKGTTLYEDEY